MRIIDNKHDFYDYLQDPTDTVVFDRRNSFLLTKEIMCDKLYQGVYRYLEENKERYILMQCRATFWLVKAVIQQNDLGRPENYILTLIASWKNYNKANKLLVIESIEPHAWHYCLKEKRKETVDDMIAAIDHNDYRKLATINEYSTWNGNKKTTHEIPILKASGLASVIDPLEMFCSIEEYFSREKTMAETTEPRGITNDDKIIMHGFDTKTSFRREN
jgi:hypothetical protein